MEVENQPSTLEQIFFENTKKRYRRYEEEYRERGINDEANPTGSFRINGNPARCD